MGVKQTVTSLNGTAVTVAVTGLVGQSDSGDEGPIAEAEHLVAQRRRGQHRFSRRTSCGGRPEPLAFVRQPNREVGLADNGIVYRTGRGADGRSH